MARKPHLPDSTGLDPAALARSLGALSDSFAKAAVDGNSTSDLEQHLPEPPSRAPHTSEIGWSGLEMYDGWVDEEWHDDLRGNRYIAKFREMSDEDPTVGAILLNIEQIMRQVDWEVIPADGFEDDDEALAYRDFFTTAFNDLSMSFNDVRASILRPELVYGWSFHEIVYKRRVGPYERDGRKRSKHNDRLIGWRKFPGRSAETLWRWDMDEHGNLAGMWQHRYADHATAPIFIPIEKALLFRTTVDKNNPQGRSLLRNAYRPWRYRKRLEEIEGIGIERDLAGLPVAHVPPSLLSDTATADEKAVLAAIKKIITGVRRNEQAGVIFPLSYDSNGNRRYELSLLSTGGSRQLNISGAIERKALEIAQAMLFDFLMLGHEKAGSWALGVSKIDQSLAALDAWLDDICEVFNQHAILRLGKINGFNLEKLPQLSHTSLKTVDLGAIGDFLQKATAAGAAMFPDPELEAYLREVAGLPAPNDDVVQAEEELATLDREARVEDAKHRRDNPGGPLATAAAAGNLDDNGKIPTKDGDGDGKIGS